MKDWIPIIETLIWPSFLIILIIAGRKWLKELLKIIKYRIEAGSEMSIGPSGFSLGSAPKLKTIVEENEDNLIVSDDSKLKDKKNLKQNLSPNSVQSIYLIHGAKYYKKAGPTNDRRDFYTVKVQLYADNETILNKIEKVIYYRHPTFKDKTVLEVRDPKSNFEMVTRIWGQFNLKAEIFFKGLKEPLVLYRYLNF